MDLEQARTAKAELARLVRETVEGRVRTRAVVDAGPGISLGLSPRPDGGYDVALRYRLGVPTARMLARRVVESADGAVDVRRTGRIRAERPAGPQPRRGGAGPRPPVVTALSVGETRRVRPLRPGVSIGHVDVSAGTLGAFVRIDGVLHALSNHHVLAGSPSATVGDAILQPGPTDGGRQPEDEVGTLAGVLPLRVGGGGRLDAAVARLDDSTVDLDYPCGRVTTTAAVAGAEEVEKIGRTTGVTRGRVTAIELDDVVVGYGEELGDLVFDDQIEVEGLRGSPFSRGGDSGSLVYRTSDGAAVGLLFAGSESGGQNGAGLTYLHPITPVLTALGAELEV